MKNKLDELQDCFYCSFLLKDGSSIKIEKGTYIDNVWYENKNRISELNIFFKEKLFASVFIKDGFCPKFYFTCICNTLEGKTEVVLNFGYMDKSADLHLSSVYLSSLIGI